MKIISLALALLLMLSGCGKPEPVITPPPVTTPAPATEPPALYDKASEIEKNTDGAIKAYSLGLSDAIGFLPLGDDLLLFSGERATTLTRCTGQELRPCAALSLPFPVSPGDGSVVANETGVTCYDPTTRELIFLDAMLKETARVLLPETMCGTPVLSADWDKLYYSTGHTLRCLNLSTGLDRLLAELSAPLQPEALHWGDGVILCRSTDVTGRSTQLYLCAETGRLLYETADALTLYTGGSSYFAAHGDGIYTELITGSSEHGPTLLTPHTYGASAFPLLLSEGAVLVTDDASALRLDYYHLPSGTQTAAVTVPAAENPWNFYCAAPSEPVWFLCYDPALGSDVLCRWDPAKTRVADSRSCLSARHSAENPDLQGLAACRVIADRLSQRYGVQILLWTDATYFQPEHYTLVPEHQVPVIRESLEELERFLSLYPGDFFRVAAEQTACGQIQICLVRDILGNEDAVSLPGLQFWDSGRNAFLCLPAQPEQLVQNACREMFHIIDSRVLTLCKAYDDWNSLNPKDFRYDPTAAVDCAHWLEGSGRAFIDAQSMTYPKEDRARVMAYAMGEGHSHYFTSDTMQKKLRMLCQGIRDVFGLKGSSETFLWEQYLTQPLKGK